MSCAMRRPAPCTCGSPKQSGVFELRISDNGRGITDAEIADTRSIGLLGMRERAALVGGAFEIAGRAGQGDGRHGACAAAARTRRSQRQTPARRRGDGAAR